MIILGISCFYHDSSAAIIKDGEIIAAGQEERFTRVKHDNGFPYKAIEFCLDSLKISMSEVDFVVFYEKPIMKFDRVLQQHIKNYPKSFKIFLDTIPSWINEKLQIRKILKKDLHYFGKVYFLDHHLSHAAASFLTSPFDEPTVVTIDGVGEWATTTMGHCEGNKITLEKQINFPDSLGLLYSAMTAYLGFAVNNDEYKVMGLSGYGNWKKYYPIIRKIIKVKSDGGFSLEMKYFAYEYKEKMFTEELCKLLGGPARKMDSPMETRYEDIAAALQRVLEDVVFEILEAAHKKYKSDNLILSGGVALNSLMNGKILNKTKFKNLYITPDPGDGGSSLGAALYVYYSVLGNKGRELLKSPYLGPSFDYFQIEKILKKFPEIKYKLIIKDEDLIEKASEMLMNQKVIGWFQGRMEWGPRALGNRSILAAATSKEMQDTINAKVKHREMFRPFAPVILREKTSDYFEYKGRLPVSADYMLMVYPFKKEVRKNVPAVVHTDGTGRLQTVDRGTNQRYYDLIKKYYKKSGVPLILNTSFNVKGEPIVCSPEDAVKCFLGTEIDYLIIDNFIVEKI